METVLCAVTWHPSGWNGPVERKKLTGHPDGPNAGMLGDWVKKHRWAGEDWIFALDKAQLLRGRLYSYAQGDPSADRVEASGGRFNVFFYAKDLDGKVGLVGAYRNARYVSKDDRASEPPPCPRVSERPSEVM
ncbi:MAG TPA: hypothetical protein PLA94_27320 [Myxococcota bacterium]|nr:hypothetical protein [Myxococcota bacterium]